MSVNLQEKLHSNIFTTPVVETVSRKRLFTIAQKRDDYRDAQTQFLVLLTQLHDEKFTGQLSLHFSCGTICIVEAVDNHKIKT